ncbi:hypothetical protein [Haloarcula nitratireducens]|uniref:Uncharacterized protein n=1 Tax=Haloarcula nitratireducens TaxID=2487749 RepID=A0AAW4PC24_9EURY|nr:hypothetical protein [Halomicroarcula nitratireducens]MBX0295256.1 hypothetical protein [Halomicroarcula nitratireducens]
MGRKAMVAWALLVSVWAGLVGGAAVFEPSIDYVQLYAIGFAVVAFPAAYWTISSNRAIFDSAHRPGRMAIFILVIFLVTVVLATPSALLLGHTGPLGIVVQLLAYVVGLAAALYAAYGGGFDLAWERYT